MAITGKDAAYKTPNFIDDADLLPRDNSAGLEQMDYTQKFGDGGYTTGGGVVGSAFNAKAGNANDDTDRINGAKDKQRNVNTPR
jgi:hypothetical protein